MAHILRGNEVEIEGHYDLGAGKPGLATAEANQFDDTDQVRIVENCPQYTIIEITCACGKTSYVRCEH